MRIRRKKWAEKELKEAEFYIDRPEVFKGEWNNKFKNQGPIYLEIGCGKGFFISNMAFNNKDKNFIAIDMIEAMLGLSKRNIENKYKENPENLLLIRTNAERILDVFGEEDKIDRIYINFCNPWPKEKHKKRRLTHPRQLENYKKILNKNARIYFKTDNNELFVDSIDYLKQCGFEIEKITYDLHIENIFEENIITEHEEMFSAQGIKIKALIAKLK